MDKTIKVKGMHCDACKMLVKMELEENGFEDKIESISLESDNEGLVNLTNVSEEEVEKAKEVIDAMESYTAE